MIFETETTTAGTKRKRFQYCENGKEARACALRDMGKGLRKFFDKEKQILEFLQFDNIIYLH